MGVEGPQALGGTEDPQTQDFVMVDNPTFFIPDALEYARFSGPLLKAKGKLPSAARASLFFLPGKLREVGTLFALYFVRGRFHQFGRLLKFVSKRIDNPLATQFWSTTPSRFGDGGAMKFTAAPSTLTPQPPPKAGASPDYLRAAMKTHLKDRAAKFDFRVQLQEDPKEQPIEDPTVEWATRFISVATIRIPSQDFDTPGRMAFGENLSFTPWHALDDHRPLGGINRTRLAVYRRLSEPRHELNDTPMSEPRRDDPGEASPR